MNVLYVEDDLELAESVCSKLRHWYNIETVASGQEALEKIDEKDFDLVIIDYFLPDFDGVYLCQKIRNEDANISILMLTSDKRHETKISALEIGADDFLTKPFHFDEVLARIRALFRRANVAQSGRYLECGLYKLDQKNMELFYNEEKIDLKRKEFLLFQYLILHKGQVVSRDRLYEHVWGEPAYESNTVDVHIGRLRKKIERPNSESVIKTIYGLGYRISDED